jgi:branched-subunit amino acid transport protein
MMEVRGYVLAVFLGMAVVTYLPRVLPLVVLSRFSLPPLLLRWLSFVPVAVLSALLAPDLAGNSEYLLAAVPTFAVALLSRSLMGTVLTGIAAIVLLRFLG